MILFYFFSCRIHPGDRPRASCMSDSYLAGYLWQWMMSPCLAAQDSGVTRVMHITLFFFFFLNTHVYSFFLPVHFGDCDIINVPH